MKRACLIICSLIGLLLIIVDCANVLITPFDYGGGSNGSLGNGPNISENLTPPSGGVTEDYLDDLEDFLDDTYEDSGDYSDEEDFDADGKPTTSPSCTCGSSCACSSCTQYEGSYNGYFKDLAGNYYFITKATTSHSASSMITGFDGTLYVYYIYNNSGHVTIPYTGDIYDIKSINGYYNFFGQLYSQNTQYTSGRANWRGYVQDIGSYSHSSYHLVRIPNDVLPDVNGVDMTSENGMVAVDGIAYNTYHARIDGYKIEMDDSVDDAGGDNLTFGADDTYFIFNLSKLPCGMDESLVTLITM